MSDMRKLRTLEGLGYLAALMIGVGGLMDTQALRYFNALGLVFSIIIIVRLLVMNISLGYMDSYYDVPGSSDSETTDT